MVSETATLSAHDFFEINYQVFCDTCLSSFGFGVEKGKALSGTGSDGMSHVFRMIIFVQYLNLIFIVE